MNFKKNWKRFCDLSSAREGFTLVELIVVIAILAILAGVAVPAYSGYVKKANMQADMTLISEIEHALTLAMYNNPFEEVPSGVLVISKDGITLNGTAIAEDSEMGIALLATFGSLDTLKLKYDGWTQAKHLNTILNSDMAAGIMGSSYISGLREESLLSDVEKFTTMAHNISGISGTTLASLFGQELLDSTAAQYGINVDNKYITDGAVDWNKWHNDNPQEFANLVVLATAKDIDNLRVDSLGENKGYETSAATGYVTAFSTLYGFAATSPDFSNVLNQYMDAMNAETATVITYPDGSTKTVNPVTDAATGSAWWNSLQAEADKFKNSVGQTYSDYKSSGESEIDVLTFQSIMSALNATPADDVAGDLSNSNLFTEGAVKDMYDQYIAAVEALSYTTGFEGLNLQAGEIAIIYIQDSIEVYNTIS